LVSGVPKERSRNDGGGVCIVPDRGYRACGQSARTSPPCGTVVAKRKRKAKEKKERERTDRGGSTVVLIRTCKGSWCATRARGRQPSSATWSPPPQIGARSYGCATVWCQERFWNPNQYGRNKG
jgi:hypothetical protein